MKAKLDILRERWAAGDTVGALSIASKFFDRSDETILFKRAQGALQNPSFYRQMGKDPDAIAAAAFDAMAAKFKLQPRPL